MVRSSLRTLYFPKDTEVDPPRKVDLRLKGSVPSNLKINRVSSLAESRAVEQDNWLDVPRTPTYTPYGKGTITGLNTRDTHYRVEFRNGVHRRIIKANCLEKMKLASTARQARYETDSAVISTTGRKYKGVMDEFRFVGSDPVVLEQICRDNNIEFDKYRHLNPGHQRMCVGNILRARVKRGEKVILILD